MKLRLFDAVFCPLQNARIEFPGIIRIDEFGAIWKRMFHVENV